jgi:hypothetical protein
MRNLWSKLWFRITTIIVGIVVLFVVYTASQGSLRTASTGLVGIGGAAPKAVTSQNGIDFPQQFAGFSGESAGAPAPSYDAVVRQPGTGTTSKTDAKIIQTGSLTIEVKDIKSGLDGIKAVADAYQGFVIDSNYYESPSGQRSGTATIKVPFKQFNAALTDLKKLATFVGQETTNTQDVTEEYTDLQSSLRNMKAEEVQYLGIMKQALKIQDILDVESRLADVRGRIESTQGRINYYDARTDYSTINVQLTEKYTVKTPENKWRPWELIVVQTKQLISNLQGFVDNIIGFVFWLIALIPYLIVLGLIYWIIRRIVKRKHAASGPNS